MEQFKTQLQDALLRMTSLEQRERKNSDEIVRLTSENKEFAMKIETCARKFENLSAKCVSLEKTGTENGARIISLQKENNNLNEKLKKQESMLAGEKKLEEKIAEVDRIRKVLNRSLAAAHEKMKRSETETDGKNSNNSSQGEQSKTETKIWDKINELFDNVRFMNREIGQIEAIQEQLKVLHSEIETSSTSIKKQLKASLVTIKDEHRKQLDDLKESLTSLTGVLAGMKKSGTSGGGASKNMGTDERLDKFEKSIFCAKLECQQPLSIPGLIRLSKCQMVLTATNSPFVTQTGHLNPAEDGVYNLGWKIHQGGDGKIQYVMAVEGVDGRLYLGHTEKPGDVCSGMFIMPLKQNQKVWLEAKCVRGQEPRILSCNFMGWMMKPFTMGSLEELSIQQQKLFHTIKMDCQHL